jgi:hypothetical protein
VKTPKALEIARGIAQNPNVTAYDLHSDSPEQRLFNIIASLKLIKDNLLEHAHAIMKNDPAKNRDLEDLL